MISERDVSEKSEGYSYGDESCVCFMGLSGNLGERFVLRILNGSWGKL